MTDQSPGNPVYDTTIRLLALSLIVAWCLLIMNPFVSIIMWSLILALALYPLHKGLAAKMGGRPKLASFIIVILFLVIVILPMGLLISSLVDEVKELKASYDSGTLTIPPPSEKVKEWPVIGEKLYDNWKAAADNLGTSIVKYKDQLTANCHQTGKGNYWRYHSDSAPYNSRDLLVTEEQETVLQIITSHYAYSTTKKDSIRLQYWLSGISFNFLYDSRDNAVNPYSGRYAFANIRVNPEFLGQHEEFESSLAGIPRLSPSIQNPPPAFNRLVDLWLVSNFRHSALYGFARRGLGSV